MSMFKKPKRNIRRRYLNDDDEDNENRMESEDTQSVKIKPKKKEKPKQTLLGFGEELEEADEGEVFKVNKTSRSKRLMKLQVDSESANMSVKQEKDLEIKTFNRVSDDEESEHGNGEEEWEAQLFRRGVNPMMAPGVPMEIIMMPAPPPPPLIHPPDPTKVVPVVPEEILNKIRGRLQSLKEVHRRHQLDYEQLQLELVQTVKELEEGEDRAPLLARRFKDYQELRGYQCCRRRTTKSKSINLRLIIN